ncbi:MAG: fibronectin type III domain-containing protein, partial [Tannerella sp.]|nr:fibronectin type III domain-containing protein [Tannerella sp.]
MKRSIKYMICGMCSLAVLCGLPACVEDFDKEIASIDASRLFKPLTLVVENVSTVSVTLSWKAAAPAFEVEYSLTPDFSDGVAVQRAEKSPCVVDNLEEMTGYWFRVRGVSGSERPAPSHYSDAVSATTLAGTMIENVAAVAEMTYTTDPVVITTTVTLTWGADGADVETVDAVTFTAGSNPPLAYPVSPEEAAARRKVISDGLDVATTYVVRLYRGTKIRGLCTVTTPDAPLLPSDNMTVVTPDMGDLRDIILNPSRKDTLYLQPGIYALTSADNTTALTRNLVMISADPATTVVNASKSFNPEGSIDRIVFRNITFHCATYLMQQKIATADKQFTVGEYRIENCVVDLSSTQSVNSTLLSVDARTAGLAGRIGGCSRGSGAPCGGAGWSRGC